MRPIRLDLWKLAGVCAGVFATLPHVHFDIFPARSTIDLTIHTHVKASIALGALITRILMLEHHSFAHVLDVLFMQQVTLVVCLNRHIAFGLH